MTVSGLLNVISFILMGSIYFGFFYLMGYKKRENIIPSVIYSGVLMALVILINIVFKNPIDAYDYTSILNIFLWAMPYFFFVPVKRRTFLLSSIAIMAILDYVQYIAESFLDKSETSIMLKSASYCIIYIVAIVIIVIADRKRLNVPKYFLDELPVMVYVSLFFVEFSSFYNGESIKGEESNRIVLLILNSLSAGLLITSVIYLLYNYTKKYIDEKSIEFQLQAEISHYEDMVSNNREVRRFRHDFKNNLFSVSSLLRSNKLEEAKAYVDELIGQIESSTASFSTGNYLADAILSEKSKKAIELGTEIVFMGVLPDATRIKNTDLCTIIANAIDNAIRECDGIPNARITIQGKENEHGSLITIKNPVKQKVTVHNNSLSTTKSDKNNHGFGISNIKRAVEKYNGTVNIICDEKEFKIEIRLLNR